LVTLYFKMWHLKTNLGRVSYLAISYFDIISYYIFTLFLHFLDDSFIQKSDI